MKWKVLQSKELLKLGFFRLRDDKCELPDGRVMPHYYVIEFADWVNVLPVTTDGQVVAVEQFRHGSDQMHLEIPGGSLDPRISEEPQVAGERELLEETGYAPSEMIYCGFHYPNPALQNNRMHTFIAWNCKKVAEQNLDPFEDLSVKLFPLSELQGKLERGEFTHSLIAASVALALPKLREMRALKK
jgi:8-oxo-dGTP pyrophosphatase MutT (NUDIX family)